MSEYNNDINKLSIEQHDGPEGLSPNDKIIIDNDLPPEEEIPLSEIIGKEEVTTEPTFVEEVTPVGNSEGMVFEGEEIEASDEVLIDGEGSTSEPEEIELGDDEDALVFDELTEEERAEIMEHRELLERGVSEDGDELIPPVLNATIRKKYTNEESPDKFLMDVAKGLDSKEMDVSDLPGIKGEIALKEATIKLIDARLKNMSKEVDKYATIISSLNQTFDSTGISDELFNNEEAQIEQGILNPDTGELINTGGVKVSYTNKKLKGKAAIFRAMEALGIGEAVRVMLPHTGIWVNIEPPTEWEIVSFYHILFREKVNLGRSTIGFTFSASSVSVSRDLFNFVLKHIRSTSVKGFDVERLGDILHINDFPILLWGMARAIYPHGFPYRRRCDGYYKRTETGETGEFVPACDHIETVNLSLDKLIFVDNSRLTTKQKKLMSVVKSDSITIEQQREYVDQFDITDGITVKHLDATIHFKYPTMSGYLEDGLDWIDRVTREHDIAIAGGDYDADMRSDMLESYVNSTSMRNWSHYVHRIEYSGGFVVEDRESIRSTISMYSANKDFSAKFVEALIKYRNKSVIASIGVPEFKCPKCNELQEGPEDFPVVSNVIPLAPLNLFFIMLITKFRILTISMDGN